METDSGPDQNPPAHPADAPIVCPQCGAAIEDDISGGPVIQCPRCGNQFFASSVDAEEDAAARARAEAEIEESKESELSALRIKHYSVERRNAYRMRSYMVVLMLGCLGLAIQLIIAAEHDVRNHHRWRMYSIGYILFGIAALMGTVEFAKRAAEVQRNITSAIRARELEEAEAARHEPEFSLLSDGSHAAKNLETMLNEAHEQDGNVTKPG